MQIDSSQLTRERARSARDPRRGRRPLSVLRRCLRQARRTTAPAAGARAAGNAHAAFVLPAGQAGWCKGRAAQLAGNCWSRPADMFVQPRWGGACRPARAAAAAHGGGKQAGQQAAWHSSSRSRQGLQQLATNSVCIFSLLELFIFRSHV
ncbi:hypothetical protein GQ55_3G411800 [Panicum hallii var. hallii]|uniref:Uncharacterized protein n=1 Tax=Panicum hallii var. hallii TaxID=1504633 RepID=A0A2T7EH76_9POAL|nr:hypothetical protein GQ55_3G411800 [Panicum hallii var. hallii]